MSTWESVASHRLQPVQGANFPSQLGGSRRITERVLRGRSNGCTHRSVQRGAQRLAWRCQPIASMAFLTPSALARHLVAGVLTRQEQPAVQSGRSAHERYGASAAARRREPVGWSVATPAPPQLRGGVRSQGGSLAGEDRLRAPRREWIHAVVEWTFPGWPASGATGGNGYCLSAGYHRPGLCPSKTHLAHVPRGCRRRDRLDRALVESDPAR
jgi:hypothetical protein